MTMRIDWMRGCGTALVTPFRRDGSIDDDCFKSLVERQIKNGVKILIPCGTTGEAVTMSEEEKIHVIRMTIEVAHKLKAKVIAGTGSNNTAATIDFTRKVRELGATARSSSRLITTSRRRTECLRIFRKSPNRFTNFR
jgi:4-hydroxy-tetrahydrodipicolinate synthase